MQELIDDEKIALDEMNDALILAQDTYAAKIAVLSEQLVPIAPFKVGDIVRILGRTHNGKTGRVTRVGFMGSPYLTRNANHRFGKRPSVDMVVLKANGSDSTRTHILPFRHIEKI